MAVEQLLWTFCAVQIEPVGPTYVNLEKHNYNNNKVGTIIIIVIIISIMIVIGIVFDS